MSRIRIDNDYKFVLLDGEKQRILLDTGNPLANKSQLPLCPVPESLGVETFPHLFGKLQQCHAEISLGTKEGSLAAMLIDLIATSHLMSTALPMRVVELGATSGILSYHLATLMGKMNPESSLCCVTNTIGNGSDNRWLNRVSRVEQPPVLSLVATDYEATPLASDYFDMAIINGVERFEKPGEAVRLLKKGGNLICHAMDAPYLEDCFKKAFPDCQEYGAGSNDKVLVAPHADAYAGKEPEPDIRTEMKRIISELQEMLQSDKSLSQFRAIIPEIDRWTDESIKRYDIASKKDLIRLKQLVIDYMLNREGALREYYREKLESFQNEMLQDIVVEGGKN